MRRGEFRIQRTKFNDETRHAEYGVVLVGGNGEPVMVTESYTSVEDAKRSIKAIRRLSVTAKVTGP